MAIPQYQFPPFELSDAQSAGPRWKKWLNRFDNYMVAMDITESNRQKAMLLHFAGERVADIYDTMKEETDEYGDTKTKLTNYFAPQVNLHYEIYVFRNAKQEDTETVDQFCTRLRTLAATCEFTDIDRELHSQIIQNCQSQELRRRALRNPKMTLKELLALARTLEASEYQAADMTKTNESTSVNAITKQFKSSGGKYTHKGYGYKQPSTQSQCWNCGGQWPHPGGRHSCPAHGKTCANCAKQNHFAQHCRQPRNKRIVNMVKDSANDSAETTDNIEAYVFTVSAVNSAVLPHTVVKLDGRNTSFVIDSGSSVNLVDETTFAKLEPQPKLRHDKISVKAYGSNNPLSIVGSFTCLLESKERLTNAKVYVVRGNSGSLLSYQTAVELGLFMITNNVVTDNIHPIIAEFPDVFQGIGKLKGIQVNLHIDESVRPVKQTHRRIPFHVRKQVEAELQILEQQDIIEKVSGPTPWVSPVVVPKPKSPSQVRLCIDMREANRAIQRERHISPTLDDLIYDLNGATVFSHLDLRCAYHQVELHPESRYITTFSTHLGLRRYKRLIFGISSASEIFQHTIAETLSGIEGVRNISDDIIVFGKGRTQEEAQSMHDITLCKVLKCLQDNGLTLNSEKCQFGQPRLEFYGHIFGRNGMSPTPAKIKAISECLPPTNATEVRSLLGMGTFCARYIPNYADMIKPMQDLTKSDMPWSWGPEQQKALDDLKSALTSDITMAYFNPDKATEIFVDAGPYGLGATLTQKTPGSKDDNRKVIVYASRALSDVESRYSQTEREALGIYWAINHFHLYLYGAKFTIITDHRPLEGIFNKAHSRPPARIERWLLGLQQYTFDTRYEPGKFNPSDYMSRHALSSECTTKENPADEYVNYLAENAVPKSVTLDEVKMETLRDATLQTVAQLIRSGQWHTVNSILLKPYHTVKDELTTSDNFDLLLRGNRIVIPEVLQQRVLSLAHGGHQGIIKTKALLREKVWFPQIDKKAETMVRNCLACQATTPEAQPQEPIQTGQMPEHPWTHLSADFFGPINNTYLLVIVDEHSRYPIVEACSSTSADAVIPILDRIFAMLGTPQVLKTDNGPPWFSHRMTQFASYLGFSHRRVTPLWPQANSEAERFMRTIGKTVQAVNINGQPLTQALTAMLRNYRATPHSTTGVAPATLLLGRTLKTQLPGNYNPPTDDHLIAINQERKEKMNNYVSAQRHTRQRQLQVGDLVLVRQQKVNKTTPLYEPVPYRITHRNGSMISACNTSTNRVVTRNISFFKFVSPQLVNNQFMCVPSLDDDDIPAQIEDAVDSGPNAAQPQPHQLVPRRNPLRNRGRPMYLNDYQTG